jgi:transposase
MGIARPAAPDQGPARALEDHDLPGALRHNRIDAPWLFDGPIDGESFRTYVEKVLVPTLRSGDIVIMHNLSRHKAKAVRQLIRAAGAKLLPAKILAGPAKSIML